MTQTQENHGTKKIFGVLLPDWVDEEVLKKLVYSFLSLVVAVLISSLFVWPRFGDLYKDEKDLMKLEKSLEALSGFVDQVEEFEQSLDGDELKALEMAVPKVFDPGLILSSLKQVGVNTGVVLETYEVDGGVIRTEVVEAVGSKGDLVVLNKHKVHLKLVGRSDNLIKFIDLLGKSSPLSVISELSLSEISKLFNQQGMSKLEMEVTYFEASLLGVELEKITDISSEDRQLLEEITGYFTPNTVQDKTDGFIERRRSIFGP